METAKFLSGNLLICVSTYLVYPKWLQRLGSPVTPECIVHFAMVLIALTATLQHWWTIALQGGQEPAALLEGHLQHALLACMQSLAVLFDRCDAQDSRGCEG